MIKIKNIEVTTTMYSKKINKRIEQFLAGDIENFMLKKGFTAQIEVV